jgi:membrane-bound lytic murein transglycosylase D
MHKIFKHLRLMMFSLVVVGLSGCASMNNSNDVISQDAKAANIPLASDTAPQIDSDDEVLPQASDQDMPKDTESIQAPGPMVDGQYTSIWDVIRSGFSMNHYYKSPRVQYFVEAYSRNPALILAITTQAKPYLYTIVQMLQQKDLPTELALLPIVESGFRPYARSYCGALGVWQLMRDTAVRFGLARDNYWFNSRMSVNESTNAALDYLKYLYNYFNGNWLMAIASYNAGEGTVQNAIARNQKLNLPTDYWSLRLPYATANYVPQFLALAIIINDPAKYGVTLPDIANSPVVGSAKLPQQMSLSQAAKFAGINEKELKALNPGMLHGVTPPKSHGTYTLNLPVDKVSTFEENCAANPGVTGLENYYYQTKAKGPYGYYTVRKGDTLTSVSRFTGVSVAQLKQYNHITNNTIKYGQKIKYPVDRTSAFSNVTYTVQAGNTLSGIAKKYHVSLFALMQWNNLKDQNIRIGQRLVIRQKIQY